MSKKKKDWKVEKARLLELELEERRKEYKCSHVPLEKISTWTKHEKSKGKDDSGEKEVQSASLCDKVSLYKGDITVLEVDAIVNAANSSLLGGGGVDGCIHKAAGPCLYDECHTLNGCDTGKAKITSGYDLPAKHVIHTVGPVARGHVGKVQRELLSQCYQNSLALVKEHSLRSVAFPCISTGIYGFPNQPAAEIALNTVKTWLKKNINEIDRVIFCVFLETDFKIYKEKMSSFFSKDEEEDEEEKVAEGGGDEGKKDTPPSKKSKSKKEGSDEESAEAEENKEDVHMLSQTGHPDDNADEDVEMSSQPCGMCNDDEEMSADDVKEQDTSSGKQVEESSITGAQRGDEEMDCFEDSAAGVTAGRGSESSADANRPSSAAAGSTGRDEESQDAQTDVPGSEDSLDAARQEQPGEEAEDVKVEGAVQTDQSAAEAGDSSGSKAELTTQDKESEGGELIQPDSSLSKDP